MTFTKRDPEKIGFNPIKIENGLIKYERTNKFNIRVNNFRRGPNGYSSLDNFVSSMHLRTIAEQEVARNQMKLEEQSKVKSEPMDIDMIQTKEEEPECFIDKIDYSKCLPDFRLIPKEVLDQELSVNGIRTLIKKGQRFDSLQHLWHYKK
jgi:hypothetical protein